MSASFVISPIFLLLKDHTITILQQPAAIINKFSQDLKISKQFLEQYSHSYETIRSYTKEIERLLLWCVHLAKINLVQIQPKYLLAYQKFLRTPRPKNIWCGSPRPKQMVNNQLNPKWRLFVADLNSASIVKIFKILKIFFKYLIEQKYLINDPVTNTYVLRKPRNMVNINYLKPHEIDAVLAAPAAFQAQNKRYTFKVIRARYVILLLFYTGLTSVEITTSKMDRFIKHKGNWFLRKTNKELLPIHPTLLQAWQDFKLEINKFTRLQNYKQIPLIPSKNLRTAITAKRINQIVKWVFNRGASSFEPHDLKTAFKLRKATTRWLRTSYIKFNLDHK